jgi:DNA repair exonuclease SbcCD ATPase subunit/DNA repair exonuclease SbcCD nuclease subunit
MTIDTYEKLNIGISRVDKIVHVSDIHIRLTKRHEEYRRGFEKLYAEIAKTPENTLIINTGDIFHSKVDLSPELVQTGWQFLKALADLRPTLLVAGNHDCLMANAARLDAVSPIVECLAHKNLFYLKDSKLYGAANILINNMSVFGDPTEYIKFPAISKKIKNEFDTKIAIYHGPVLGSVTDVGYQITNRTIMVEKFDGHDIVMLGDIHKAQDLQQYNPAEGKPIIRYAGSFLQQDHGEALAGHGFSLWDVATREYLHVEIPNEYGYFTIDVENGQLVTDVSSLPSKAKLRVRHKETSTGEYKRIVAELKTKYAISDEIYMRLDPNDGIKKIQSVDVSSLVQIGSEDYQNKLITECLKAKYPDSMNDATIAEVLKINKELNAIVKVGGRARNVNWKPIRFEFSNMFSYGENNVLDFTKLQGNYGVFAANASGKSSLMDALCFTVFDKSARAFKGVFVMNDQKNSFFGKFEFEINDVKYFIERKGTRDKKNNVKVDVDFYWIRGDEKVPLNSDQRRSTNEVIRDYLGDYEDFILTTLALQGGKGSFIDMGQSNRKELLSQFIGLDLFDKLSEKASDAAKEINGAIKTFNKEHSQLRAESLKNDLLLLESKLLDLTDRKEAYTSKRQQLEDAAKAEEAKIVRLQNVPATIDGIVGERGALTAQNVKMAAAIEVYTKEIGEYKAAHAALLLKLNEFDAQTLKDCAEKHASLGRLKQKTDSELEKLKVVVREKKVKIEHLEKHEYDKNCRYCCNSIFIKDAVAAKESLVKDMAEGKDLVQSSKKFAEDMLALEPSVQLYQNLSNLKAQVSAAAAQVSKKELDKNNGESVIEKNTRRVATINEQIALYEQSKTAIESNKIIEVEIARLKVELYGVNSTLKTINSEYIDAYSKKVSSTDQKKLIEAQIEKMVEYEAQSAAYQYYLVAVGKDGVPYQIISDVVPSIEQEVNNILSQIVEFTMELETDGKNVNAYIKYEDRHWPLDLGSGMEKFMASLALRVALVNISNLPRPNFLVVDEGFSALDASNMPLVHSLFDYLKSNFEFIIIISHLDAMRDMVDKQIEIKKENGFSKLDNTV